MDEIVREFLIESHENLDTLDRELVELERNPGATETLGSIFRTIHTIKGTCGFLGFGKLESITHVGENLLSKLRDGELTLDQEITDALLALIDAVRGILAAIEATEAEGDGEYGELVAELSRLQEPPAAGEPQEPPARRGPRRAPAPPPPPRAPPPPPARAGTPPPRSSRSRRTAPPWPRPTCRRSRRRAPPSPPTARPRPAPPAPPKPVRRSSTASGWTCRSSTSS